MKVSKIFISYDRWTGKIFRISNKKPLFDKNPILETSEPLAIDIYMGKKHMDNYSVAYDFELGIYELQQKSGTIYLSKPEEYFSEVYEHEDSNSDIIVKLYTNNKLLEIMINYNAVKNWYNHRMKSFKFSRGSSFIFRIEDDDGNTLKTLTIYPKEFLETFQTTIDLSDIDKLDNIKILTKRIFKSYSFVKTKNKYYLKNSKSPFYFYQIDNKPVYKKIYDIIILRTTKPNTYIIKNNIKNPNSVSIYKSLDFYITGRDPNELHGILSIDISELWGKEVFRKKISSETKNKIIWCNNSSVNVLFNSEKEIQI